MNKKIFRLMLSLMAFTLLLFVTVVLIGIKQRQESDNTSKDVVEEVSIPETMKPTEKVVTTKKPEPMEQTTIPEEIENVTISFVGDVLFSDGVIRQYDQNGISGILSDFLSQTLINSDITMVNEEFPFSDRGTKMEDKQYTFKLNPDRVNILSEFGVDIVTLANNHALDFGRDALLDTFHTLDSANIQYVGAGENIERAKQIEFRTVEGIKFAFLAASRVIPVTDWNANSSKSGMLTTYDPTILLEQIKLAEQEADLTIVYVHWGVERKDTPEEYQTALAKQYIDVGADIVVGSHPHCLQGIEFYKDKPIIYSLGNFIFGSSIEKTAILQATVDKNFQIELKIIPCKGTNFYTQSITNETDLKEFYQYLTNISYGVSFAPSGKVLN